MEMNIPMEKVKNVECSVINAKEVLLLNFVIILGRPLVVIISNISVCAKEANLLVVVILI
jgi:hypothetical protein